MYFFNLTQYQQTYQLYNRFNHYIRQSIHYNQESARIILETYGMIEYSNMQYSREIMKCAEQIEQDIKNNNLKYDSTLLGLNIFRKYVINLSFCTKWIDHLNVYISTEYENINDAGLISTKGTSEYVIQEKDIDLYTFPYALKDGKIKFASIYINYVDINDSNFKLEAVIEHELKHIYDMYVIKCSEHKLNQDIVYSQKYNYYSHRNIINYVSNIQKFKELNIKADDVCGYILNITYLLNVSEIQARIVNTKSQLFKLDIDEIFSVEDNRKNNGTLRKSISGVSNIYNEYYVIYNKLKMSLYLSSEQQDIFDNKFLNIFNDVYSRKFKNYKDFIKFLLQRMDKLYFRHIDNLYNDTIDKIEHILSK